MRSAEHILEVEGLTAGYGPQSIIRNLSFAMRTAGILAIVGANGSGKSTLLKALCGLVPERSGKVRFGERDLINVRPDELIQLGISYVPQGGSVIPALRVRDHFDLVTRHLSANEAGTTLATALDRFPELRPLMPQRAGNMSGGERQLLSHALLIAQGTTLWLLDEPTAGLAPAAVDRTVEFIRSSNEDAGRSVILVEHDHAVARKLAGEVLVIKDGGVARRVVNVRTDEKQTNFELT